MIDRELSTTGTAYVEQLSAQDASFLYVENEKVANHVGGLYVYDQSAVPGGDLTFKGILRYLESKLHLVPRYRQRLVEVPGNIDHPYWVDDPNFDLEYHVRHMALPKPGDWRQLCIQTSRIYDRPLDMDRRTPHESHFTALLPARIIFTTLR